MPNTMSQVSLNKEDRTLVKRMDAARHMVHSKCLGLTDDQSANTISVTFQVLQHPVSQRTAPR